MPFNPASLSSLLPYAAPPVLGAFIGYLTNKVAIKMLFRPLTAKYIFGVRIPMTPGVIPSKRADLAVNIGEMVGTHLLTSEEIGKALEKKSFQKTLFGLIESRGEKLLGKDLGPVAELVPEKYKSYYSVAEQALVDQSMHLLIQIRSKQFLKNLLMNSSSAYLPLICKPFYPDRTENQSTVL